jgi:hypothetical protein
MKKIFVFLTAVTLFTSCGDDYFDINRDLDDLDANSASLSTELPAGIAGIAGAEGSYYALIGGFWAQFWTQSNTSNQYKEIDDYSIGTLDYNGGWTAMYDALGDIRNIKRKAEAAENWNYYLIASVLEAQASQVMADLYDQVPYTEANNVNLLQPTFDSGSAIYDAMAESLQVALSKDLSTSQGEIPAADDFLFGGNMAHWTEFANTMLLKVYMRQTEARASVAEAGITALITSGAPFLDTDAAMTQFEDAPDRSNPLFETDRRQLNTTVNLRASKTMFSYLDENGDPRKLEFYDYKATPVLSPPNSPPAVSQGNALNQGDFNNTVAGASIAVVTLYATTPVYFMSREESLFLQAEALERYAGGAGAKEKYDAAVIQAFSRWQADDNSSSTTDDLNDGETLSGASFVAPGGAYAYPTGAFQDKLKAIITQKWLALFPGNGFEAFFEQNRTGYPLISAVPQTSLSYVPGELSYSVNGTTGGVFPRRLVFPENVTSTNENAPDLIDLTVPVWWDVN